MNITPAQLKPFSTYPELATLCTYFNKILPAHGITTKNQVCMFLAQSIHESAGFTVLSENLNYSAEGLIKNWPARFNATIAVPYAHNPTKIANKVYADRLGNGNEASGDGWKYRGRGIFQLTGKSNYTRLNQAHPDLNCVSVPESLMTFPSAITSAAWFWMIGNESGKTLNAFADKNDCDGCSKIVNGGKIGLIERRTIYLKLQKVIS